jgi:hypothetical protein
MRFIAAGVYRSPSHHRESPGSHQIIISRCDTALSVYKYMGEAMKFLGTTMLALSLALFAAQAAVAGVISDGSNGVFRPTADFTLDLSGSAFPQYSSIYIDAGIRLTVLTPTGGAFGDLLAADDIFVNGIIDAGAGNLGLLAGNQIVLGVDSQIFAGSLLLSALTVDASGTITLVGGSGNSGPLNPLPRGPLSPIPEPSTLLLLLPGLALLARKSWWH